MIVAILTLPVLLYQLLFVAIMYIASRVGPRTMLVALIACLAWTVTHLFFPPLAIVQAAVISVSYWWFGRGRMLQVGPALIAEPRNPAPLALPAPDQTAHLSAADPSIEHQDSRSPD